MFNTKLKYGWVILILHWLFSFGILGLLFLNYREGTLFSKAAISLDESHLMGVQFLFILLLIQLFLKLLTSSLEPVSVDSFIIKTGDFIARWLLYLCVFAHFFIDIGMVQLQGKTYTLFGTALPKLFGSNSVFADYIFTTSNIGDLHYSASITLAGLSAWILFSVVVIHHFIFGDETLKRLWFGYTPSLSNDFRIRTARRHSKR